MAGDDAGLGVHRVATKMRRVGAVVREAEIASRCAVGSLPTIHKCVLNY